MIRNDINTILYPVLKDVFDKDIFIVEAQLNTPRPDLPYVSINQISLIPQDGFGAEYRQIVHSTNEDFDYDILDSRKTEDMITISVSIHATTIQEAYDIGNFFHDALDYTYRNDMLDKGYALVGIQALQNRTIYQVDKFNYTYGFDILYRIDRTIQLRKDTIETVIINDEGIDL